MNIMRQLFGAVAIALAVAPAALAQHVAPDPVVSLPKNYQLEFENDWVRIVRVHYDANSELPDHEHPGGMTLYLYFNANEGVMFKHDEHDAAFPRPPVQPGVIRIKPATLEHHTVQNTGSTPSDFIRILLKTEVDYKIGRANTRMAVDVMEYNHPTIAVRRINVAPHSKARLEAKNFPIVRIAAIPGKTAWRIAATNGYRVLEKGTTEEFENTGDVPIQLVTIETRTKLLKP